MEGYRGREGDVRLEPDGPGRLFVQRLRAGHGGAAGPPAGWAGGGFPTNGPPDNHQDFGDFVYAVASRYRGRIRAYQIWNEPNLAREWGGRSPNAAEYVQLLRVAYGRIKEADPNAMVITAGLTPTGTQPPEAVPDDQYLRRMYQAGLKGSYDVLGAHGAGYKAPRR